MEARQQPPSQPNFLTNPLDMQFLAASRQFHPARVVSVSTPTVLTAFPIGTVVLALAAGGFFSGAIASGMLRVFPLSCDCLLFPQSSTQTHIHTTGLSWDSSTFKFNLILSFFILPHFSLPCFAYIFDANIANLFSSWRYFWVSSRSNPKSEYRKLGNEWR